MELQQIHSAENQLSRILPRLSKAVESEKLRELLDERLDQGERILKEVESALDEVEASPGRRKNVAAEGLINDVREHIQEIESGPALDAVLIAGLQKTEHYCIAAWGTARSLAQATGQNEGIKVMERALKEGKELDQQLTELAEQEVTPKLLPEEEEGGGDSQPRSRRGGGGSERHAST